MKYLILALLVVSSSVSAGEPWGWQTPRNNPVSYCKFPESQDVVKVAGTSCPRGATKIGSGKE